MKQRNTSDKTVVTDPYNNAILNKELVAVLSISGLLRSLVCSASVCAIALPSQLVPCLWSVTLEL